MVGVVPPRMFRSVAIALAACGLSVGAAGQSPREAAVNLVPNPGFEDFRVRPLGWYYKGANYTRVLEHWFSPTAASPDAYSPVVRVPAHWEGKGFGQREPYAGAAMTGITVYGCGEGKPHCREYTATPLLEELVAGQTYRLSVRVAALPRGLRVDQLGAALAPELSQHVDDRRLDLRPVVKFDAVAEPGEGWLELAGDFTADGGEAYLVLGNFAPDERTATAPPAAAPPLPFAYYYLDEVRLRKTEPLLPVPPPRDLGAEALVSGEVIELRNVYFGHDDSQLEPRSSRELDQLAQLLARHPEARLRIVGHTDATGAEAYNRELSRRRAAAVVDYLTSVGVDAARLTSEGRGLSEAVADNATERGRALNRRVVAEVW